MRRSGDTAGEMLVPGRSSVQIHQGPAPRRPVSNTSPAFPSVVSMSAGVMPTLMECHVSDGVS